MKSLISKVGHSVMMRLALIIGAMGVMIGIAIYVSWTVFQSIENQMHTMSDERLPQLRASAGVTTAVDETRALLSEILIANTTDELAELRDKQSSTTSAFREALSALPANQLESASGLLNDTETALAALLDSREAEQQALADAALTLADAFGNATSVSARLEEATDTALFDMTLSGEDAITSIDQTLSGLVERDFAQFQTVLAIQSEVNLLTGLGLSLESGFSAATQSIAEDLALSSIDRLRSHLDLAAGEESLSQVADKISIALETYERVFGSSLSSPNSQEILDLRVAIDSVLSPAVDDVNFNLIISSEEAKETSKVALSGLLETEVAKMRNMASLDAATKSFFAFALKAAVARDPLELDLVRVKLAEQETVVRSLMTGETEESIVSGIEKLLALSQQGMGIADKRSAVFASKIAAGEAAADASRAVSAIAIETAAFATNSVDSIKQTANNLGIRVATAGNQIAQIGWISFVFLLAAPIFVWALITRPLNRVTQVTERLANGDLSEIQGLRSNEGELGRLAKALYVFRENALQTIEMREEEKKREKAALEEEKANEQARRAEIEAQKKLQQEREEEAQAQTEAARQKMIGDLSASLGFVVSAASEGDFSKRVDASFEDKELVGLANSVNLLVESVEAGLSETARVLSLVAAGDLTENMVGSFRGAFADLQNDTNGMIDALRDLIIDITNSGVTLSGSSAELRDTSNGLSHRAEQNAASLEETSAALEELTVSVKQVSETVADANKNASLASNTAKSSGTVAAEAAEAMSRISDASSEITKVVSVINEIAFQINLLALNAGVEAARAGDAGRGFSVVASEVRQLAQRAANSVSEISDVIAQSDTAVSEGVAKVSNAKDSLEQISESVIGVSQSINMISAAINEQVNGIGEINSAVAQIDNNTQKQAASFEEVTAASALLSSEADALRHSTARFKTARESVASKWEQKKAV